MPMQKLLEHAFVHFLDIIEIRSSLKKLALGLEKEKKKKRCTYILLIMLGSPVLRGCKWIFFFKKFTKKARKEKKN